VAAGELDQLGAGLVGQLGGCLVEEVVGAGRIAVGGGAGSHDRNSCVGDRVGPRVEQVPGGERGVEIRGVVAGCLGPRRSEIPHSQAPTDGRAAQEIGGLNIKNRVGPVLLDCPWTGLLPVQLTPSVDDAVRRSLLSLLAT
jgi:hypothetical protein